MFRVVARLLVHHGDRSEFARRTVILLDDDGAVGHGAADGIEGGGVSARGQLGSVRVIALVFSVVPGHSFQRGRLVSLPSLWPEPVANVQ